MATAGSTWRKVLQDAADANVISASCATVGSGMVAQSEKIIRPSFPHLLSGKSITKQEEADLTPGAVFTMVKPAIRTLDVAFSAPATIASASSSFTIMAPQSRGSVIRFRASSRETPLCFLSSWYSAA